MGKFLIVPQKLAGFLLEELGLLVGNGFIQKKPRTLHKTSLREKRSFLGFEKKLSCELPA